MDAAPSHWLHVPQHWILIHNILVFCLFDYFACKMGLQTSSVIKSPLSLHPPPPKQKNT
jgi:hypothetical protein